MPFCNTKSGFQPIFLKKRLCKILKEHPEIKEKLEEAKKKDANLAKSHYWQLFFIYQNSEYFDKAYRRYPVYRVD